MNYYGGDKMTAFELGAMIEPTGVAYNGLFVRGGGIRPAAMWQSSAAARSPAAISL